MRQVKEPVIFSCFSSLFPASFMNRKQKRLCVCVWDGKTKNKAKKRKCVGVKNWEKGPLLVWIWSRFLGMRTFLFCFKGEKREFFSFLRPRVRKSCESNSCCFLFSKQRPWTHWKLIPQSGLVVKWNGHGGMSQFFFKSWQFVPSGKSSQMRTEYLMAPFLEGRMLRNVCIFRHETGNLFSAAAKATGLQVRDANNKTFSTCV